MAKDIFQSLYDASSPVKSLPYYKPTKSFAHGAYVLVCRIEGEGDGQTVEVYEMRLPATFYTVKVLEGRNSIGQPQKAFEITTGSGKEMGELAGRLAVEIAKGMIGFSIEKGRI